MHTVLHDCVFRPSIPQANSPVGYEQGCIDDRLVIYAQSAQIVVQCMANKDHIVFEQALQCQLSIPAPVCHTLQGAPHGLDENKTATYRQFLWHMWISSTLQLLKREMTNEQQILPPERTCMRTSKLAAVKPVMCVRKSRMRFLGFTII